MKGTRPSPSWNAPATSWKRPGSPSKSRWPSHERGISSPPTRRWPPVLTVSLPPSSSNTLGGYAEQKLGITLHDLLALGRQNPNDSSERFNMAYLAIRGSGAVNGVSRLHGKVSRHLFLPLFPRWPEDEVPIGHVTNGVHMPTWDSAASRRSVDGSLRKGPLAGDDGNPGAGHSPRLRRQALAISHRRQQVSRGIRSRTIVPGNWPPPARRPRRSKPRSISLIPTP